MLYILWVKFGQKEPCPPPIKSGPPTPILIKLVCLHKKLMLLTPGLLIGSSIRFFNLLRFILPGMWINEVSETSQLPPCHDRYPMEGRKILQLCVWGSSCTPEHGITRISRQEISGCIIEEQARLTKRHSNLSCIWNNMQSCLWNPQIEFLFRFVRMDGWTVF